MSDTLNVDFPGNKKDSEFYKISELHIGKENYKWKTP
jgi:hypothetical protein